MSSKMPKKMYDNGENCFLREFRLFFILLRVFGIEMPGHSPQTKQIMEDKKSKLISCFYDFLRYILILILCLATVNAILWLIILPRGSKEIANTFLTLSVELFYVLMSSPKSQFPARELMTSLRLRSFAWESIQDKRIRYLRSKASQTLTSLYPDDREVTDAVPTPISSFKVHHIRDEKYQ
ncbi:hypothetical protein TNCV_1329111 [Trichonephila clavipes]|nr:hypothetical protein TNCV_1329111 [Trichonephila clavipes]